MSISVELALASLEEQVEVAQQAKERYAAEVKERDLLIQSALDNGVPYRRLMKLTHLSRERLFRIANGGGQ